MRLPRITRRGVSEKAWKLRYKIRTALKKSDKTLADFASSSSLGNPGDAKGAGITGTLAEGKDKTAAEDSKDAKDAGFGATPAVKTLYERRNSSDSSIDWVDYPPKQMSKSAARAQDRVAIKLYKVRDNEKPVVSGRFALKTFRIDVQNPQLVAALADILIKENEHLEPSDTATFREPFRSLFFCYDDIVAKYRAVTDGDQLKTHLLLLIKVLDDVFSELRAKRRGLLASGLISYKLAWTLFPKGAEVISWGRGNNTELVLKIVDTVFKLVPPPAQNVLVIRCKALRFNGEAFVWHDIDLEIAPWEGNKPITDLPYYPLSFMPDAEQTKKRLVERGKKVLEYQGLTYCLYSGIGIYHEDKRLEKHNVDGRILIDVVGFNKHHLAQGIREGKDPETRKNMVRGTGRPTQPPDRKALEKAKISKRLDAKEQQKNKEAMLERESDLVFISPLIDGYALKNKLWLSFYVEDIKPMAWNDEAFGHLVYDEQQKDLVLAFVENHNRSAPLLGDVIRGKGEGLIVLLSGPPGTGKTLMAEAVADRTHRPLFYLQAEDLGINAAALGYNVKRVFQMATEWNAVILLDEADVFMAERDPHDIARNELVSIFLRELEYFRGIIFLTTNLYQTIDSAFRSRVSLHLLFKPLTVEARESVWRKFLDRLPWPVRAEAQGAKGSGEDKEEYQSQEDVATATNGVNGETETKDFAAADATPDSANTPSSAPEATSTSNEDGNNTSTTSSTSNNTIAKSEPEPEQHDVDDDIRTAASFLSEEDFRELAAWQLNGREIKNAVKMVKAWCDAKGYELTLARLENGIRVTSPHASKLMHENDTSLYDD